MTTKEKVKQEIEHLSEIELEKVYLYLSSLTKKTKKRPELPSLNLNGKLDKENIRSIAYE